MMLVRVCIAEEELGCKAGTEVQKGAGKNSGLKSEAGIGCH